jgi:hypothetical protein
MKLIVKSLEIQATVRDEGGRPTGYAPLSALMAAYGVPVGPDGQVHIRRFAEALGRRLEYVAEANTTYLDAGPLPTPPAEPVGAQIRPWIPVTAPITSGPGDRRAPLLDLVIRQFQVAVNPRYRQNQMGRSETYCNIFLWDVTRALSCEIPHWVIGDGEISSPGNGRELDANGVVAWLNRCGPRNGWTRTSAAEAHAAALQGRPAVVVWHNIKGIGHVAIIRPMPLHPTKGVPIAQAGATNSDTLYLADGFGRAAGQVEYWTHA